MYTLPAIGEVGEETVAPAISVADFESTALGDGGLYDTVSFGNATEVRSFE